MCQCCCAVLLCLLLASPVAANAAPTTLTAAQQQAVERYLLENPDVIVHALTAYRARVEDQQRGDQAAAVTAFRSLVASDGDSFPRAGDSSGPVLFAEFFDYQCGYCKRVFPDVMATIAAESRLNVVFVELPVLGPASVVAARAALAAERQGRYVEVHSALMRHRGPLSDAVILEIVRALGLDMEQLQRDMADPALQARIARNLQWAHRLGIDGTPAFVIGDGLTIGALDGPALRAAIAAVRQPPSSREGSE